VLNSSVVPFVMIPVFRHRYKVLGGRANPQQIVLVLAVGRWYIHGGQPEKSVSRFFRWPTSGL
jgi:hypothetical protein